MPDDVRRYKRVIEQSRPEVVIETGTRWGGFALMLRSWGVHVVTIDVDSSFSEEARSRGDAGISWLFGDSTSGGVVNQAAEIARGKRTMVSLDSEHSRSEEHTSELQSRENLVCRLLLEKKNKV